MEQLPGILFDTEGATPFEGSGAISFAAKFLWTALHIKGPHELSAMHLTSGESSPLIILEYISLVCSWSTVQISDAVKGIFGATLGKKFKEAQKAIVNSFHPIPSEFKSSIDFCSGSICRKWKTNGTNSLYPSKITCMCAWIEQGQVAACDLHMQNGAVESYPFTFRTISAFLDKVHERIKPWTSTKPQVTF